MRRLARFTIVSLLAAPLLAGTVEAQGNDLAVDFRTSESGTSGGKPFHGSGTGRAIISKNRLRFETTGSSRSMAMPGMTQGDSLTFIILDNGSTLIFLQPKKKQYMKVRPAETMEGMQKMMEGMGTAMKFEITGGDPKVEKLGAGPVILGHHTTHYRVTGVMKVNVGVMGQNQGIETSTVTDEYVAPDLHSLTDPFQNLGSNSMSGVFGPSFKAYTDKMKAARAKLPGFPLRSENHVTTSGVGQGSDIKTVQEVTAIHMITASPSLFEVPAGYTQITTPAMPTMPPRRAPTHKAKSG